MSTGIPAGAKRRIVILGGGFGGAYAAQELSRRLNRDSFEITLIDRNNYLLFDPLLVEAGVGTIEPRHVVVPIRKFMPKSDFRMADVLGVNTELRQVTYRVVGRDESEKLHYDHLVFALGSITRIPDNIPGLKEHGFELKSLADAVELRDRAIRLLELANTVTEEAVRRELLRIVVIGANFTGVEIAGEYQAFLKEAAKDYPNVNPQEIDVLLLEFSDRILPAVHQNLADWVVLTLTQRGLDIRTKTTVTEIGPDYALLTTGERVSTHTVVWAAGIAPNPLIAKIPTFPTGQKGYIECERDLRVKGFDNVWAVGDSATVYDEKGRPYAATAQNATRQGPHAAKNIVAQINGEPLKPFDFNVLGSFAAIGHHAAAAEFKGRHFTGFIGWVMYRGAYLMKMPTFPMKLRLLMDWILELILPTEPVQLGVHRPETRQIGEVAMPANDFGPNKVTLLR
ncbi:NAD(P)/FAD-dependent oxidoreductase [Fimbriimonas ginsengisoli]|uniref:NADH:ubiquinone reductase (non-electrogenic) n=1 Tax=Fimbriimonas ginsengisoli Gsoil 348 TaxID=661478 RepID=A0A068NL09_FIMGI|nr:FAD-dependent oxidoreductase [Fimbriimonas ginsengisoli]AIE83465.1 FAD-dependent pyridine nucleotide-disulfide oxidoreductase [Fimbriimonas ginsengisoli Gsoil 348]